MSAEMDRLEASVKRNTAVGSSVLALLAGIASQVRDAAGDRAKSLALADEIDKDSADLEAAVLANTPTPPAEQPPA